MNLLIGGEKSWYLIRLRYLTSFLIYIQVNDLHTHKKNDIAFYLLENNYV